MKVLLVDDDPSLRKVLSDILKMRGIESVPVETGAEALSRIEQQDIDVALIDLKLENMSGLEVLRGIQQRSPGTECILLTGYASQTSAIEAINLGAYAYFQKPYDVEQLLVAIRHAGEKRKGEEALQNNEKRLRTLIENGRDNISLLAADGTLLWESPSTISTLGYAPNQFVGRNLFELVHPDDQGWTRELYAQILQTPGKSQDGIFRLRHGDGTWRWIESTASNMLNEPSVRAIVINYRDITERKLAEEKLRALSTRQEAILTAIPDILMEVDREKVYTWANPAGIEFFGEDVIGKEAAFYFEGEQDTYGVVKPLFNGSEEVFYVESWQRRKDGKKRLLAWWCRVLKDTDGNVVGALSSAHDITKRKQAEEELKENISLLRMAGQAAKLGGWSVDLETNHVSWSDEVAAIHETPAGFSPLVEEGINFYAPEWREKIAKVFGDCAQKGIPYNEEMEIITANGKRVWVQTMGEAIRDNNGKIYKVQGAFQNITERKQAEVALQESKKKYQVLTEVSPVGIFRTNAQGSTTYVNPRWSQISGLSADEALGDGWLSAVHPEDREKLSAGWKQAASAQTASSAEYRFICPDGSVAWVLGQSTPEKNIEGQVVGYIGTITDITERKQVEEKLRRSEALFATLFHANPTRISITRFEDSRFLDVNETFLKSIGYTREEVVGHTSSELNDWVDPQERIRLRNLLKEQGKVKDFETQLRKKSGDIMNILISAERIELFGQACILSVGLDFTERKQAEEALRGRLTELELLYQNGLALSSLLNPQEIGQKILELLEQKLDWHHTTIRLYNPQNKTLELLAFHQPGLEGETEKCATAERFNMQVGRIEDGLTGWAVQQSRTIRVGDIANDPHYKETFPGLHSGLYTPIKLGERIVGVISIESEVENAFTEADERLLDTLANQAASALDNARLFKETRQRLVELETVNRVSMALRAIPEQDEMLAVVLEETLNALNASDGSINLLNKATGKLHKTIARGWPSEFSESPIQPGEGIFGNVFVSENPHISRDFASDPLTRPESSGQLPTGWGGACVPIRATEQTLGVMLVAIPSGRELSREQIRLLDTLAEMTGNALQRTSLHEQTIHRLSQLESLRVVDCAIAGSLDQRITLNILLDQIISQLGVDAADVLMLNFPLQTLQFTAGQGFRTGLNETATVQVSKSFAGRAVIKRRLVRVEDRETASENQSFLAFWQNEGFSNYYAVPLIIKGLVKGVLEVFHRSPFTPDSEWINFLETLAGQTAIAIDNAQLFKNLQDANQELALAYEATIEGWSHAMDLRDKETEGHTQRVTKMATDLAQTFGLNDQEILHIRRGALLHDIGKMGVPDHILLKPGKLVDVEWALMQQHPQFAYDMLQPIHYLRDSLDIPYCHHEKWDGTGYPRKLKGEEIPLAARIFAIVDVYDALTSDRPYRSAWPKAKTIKYIRELSGLQFDPQVMEKFMELLGNKKG